MAQIERDVDSDDDTTVDPVDVEQHSDDESDAEGATDEQKPKRKKYEIIPRTQKKLSGVELEARFDEWRSSAQERRDARTPEDSARRARGGIAVVLGLALLGVLVLSPVLSNSFNTQRAENAAEISDLEGQFEDAQAAPADGELADQITALTQAAAQDAGSIRDGQQLFVELYHEASVNPGSGNGVPSMAETRTLDVRKDLAQYFDPGSFLASDEEAYSLQSVLPFDLATEIDPRYPWYIRYDGENASDASVYSWSVETVTPDLSAIDKTDRAETATVVWVCRETASGEVLAWTRASYVKPVGEESGLFDDLSLVVTTAGATHQYVPGEQNADEEGED